MFSCIFFFNDPATTEIYTLSLHDALPILPYTGNVIPGGPPDVRELAALTVTKVSVGPMDNNAYLLRDRGTGEQLLDRKSTRLNSSHANISYAVFCLKKKNKK